jgi:hypothetical protein
MTLPWTLKRLILKKLMHFETIFKLPMTTFIWSLPYTGFYNENPSVLTFWHRNVDYCQCTGWCWENQTCTKVIGQECAINVQPYKSWVLCTVHWALNPSSKELICTEYSQTREMYVIMCASHVCYRHQIKLDCVTKVMQTTAHATIWLEVWKSCSWH